MNGPALRHASYLATLAVIVAALGSLVGPAAATSPPTFSSLSPNGGEVLPGGTTYGIRWTVTHDNDPSAFMTLRYSLDGGASYSYFITADPFATGGALHPWRVPTWNSSSARVRVCATAPDGSANCTASARDFTIFSQPPLVALLSPSDGARNVPLRESITLAFSPAANTSGVTWSITPPLTLVPVWTSGDTILRLTSVTPLPECTTFALTVNAGDGRGGSWSFRTLCPAPRVIMTSPPSGQIDVGLLDPIVVWFNTPMNPQSVALFWNPAMGFTATWSQNYTVVTYSHASPFLACTKYVWTISGQDPYGNPLEAGTPSPMPWDFTTQCPNPVIVATDPGHGEANVSLSRPIVVVFSTSMEEASVTWTVTPTIALTPTWTNGSTRLALDHAATLAPCTPYSVRIDGLDVRGNPLVPGPVPNPWTFTTTCGTSAYVQILSPSGGERWTGGSVHPVAWMQNAPTGGTLTWELSWRRSPTDAWQVVANGTSGSGTQSFQWSVPLVDTGSAQVRVCVLVASPVCDVSNPFAIDSTAPGVLATVPADGATGVPLDADIVVTFSEGMSRAATESAFSIVPSVPLGFVWGQADTVLTVRLDPLAPATTYTWALTCGARDASDPGNALAGCPRTFTFTTQRNSTLALTSPVGGESWTGGIVHPVTFRITNAAPTERTFAVGASFAYAGGSQGGAIGTQSVVVPGGSSAAGRFDWAVPAIDATDVVVNVSASFGAEVLAAESGPFEVDATPPTVVAFTPAGTNVLLDPTVTVAFSEPMAVPTADPFEVAWPSGAPPVAWTTVWAPGRDRFDVSLRGTRPCTTYEALVGFSTNPDATLRDDSDPGHLLVPVRWSFTTICSPSVNLLVPGGGEDWTGGTVRDVRWTSADADDATLEIALSLSQDGGASFAPIATLAAVPVGLGSFSWAVPRLDTERAVVRITATDGAGNAATATSGPFTIDSTPPALLVSFPSDGASGHKMTRDIWFVFTERVDRRSFEDAFSIAPDPGGIGFLWSESNLGGDVLVVTHSPFKSRTTYAVTFGTAARDDSDPGNALSSAVVVRFSTQPPPSVNPPVAKAVGQRQVPVGEPVTLDGTQSTGDLVRYVWRILDNQQRFVAVLTGATATFTFPGQGRYSVTLIVTDSTGATAEDTIEVAVTANPKAALVLGAGIALVSLLAASTEAGKLSLFGWILFPLYARRRRNELLEHETRGMIFGYVLVHPGDTYTDIKRNLQLTNGTLSYHLRVLEREGLIRSQTRGVHKHFFPGGAHVPEDGGGLHEVQIRMLRAVREVPGLAVKDLAGALGITSQHALYHLRALAAAGRVRLERRGIRLRCYPTDRPSAPR